jgi:hypothetical protein
MGRRIDHPINGQLLHAAVRVYQPLFVLGMAAALVTGVLAAIASFQISLPDSSRWWLLLPVPALAVWVSTLGYGCLTDWVEIGDNGIRMGEAVQCFATLLLTSVPLSAAMLIMLRYAAFLRATESSMMIDFALQAERLEGKSPQEAIHQACLLRFRPIMMTTFAALFGAMPIAFGQGGGAELRHPLGVAIVGGLLVSQWLTLYTTPVIYLYLDRLSYFLGGWRRQSRLAAALEDGRPMLETAGE